LVNIIQGYFLMNTTLNMRSSRENAARVIQTKGDLVQKSGPYLLGIDIGGTGAKAGLFTLNGELVRSGYREYRMINSLPGQAEHDAEAWWLATIEAIQRATAGVNKTEIKAIGVGCTNGLIAVDDQARPLRSAIMLWDQRTLPEIDLINKFLDRDQVFQITGNPMAPGAYSLPSILWLMHQDPEIFKSAHKLMMPGGFIVAQLTSEFTVDYSRACTTLLFDIQRLEWHTPFLDALNIPLSKLPHPLPSQAIAGKITTKAAELTGLSPGTPVVAGCMDTIGASIGSGIIDPGACFIIMGTAARVSTVLVEPSFDQRFMNCSHVLPSHWLTIGAINGVGSSLRWIRDCFGHTERTLAEFTGQDVYDLLTSEAANAPAGSKGLIFLPYISGERTPIWNPYARGVFFGITLGHTRNDFIRSVLEGAAFAIRHVIEIMEMERGLTFPELRIGGSASTNDLWNQIIADVTGKTVVRMKDVNTEVLGAAILAGVGVGLFPDYVTPINRIIAVDQEFRPEHSSHQAYNHLFQIYKELYLDVKHHFEKLAKLDIADVWVTRGG
jgi:xylulokinase